MQQNYWSPPNFWMDSKGFLHWIGTWYEEVNNLSTGTWLFLTESCGGYELSATMVGVRIEFLPPRSTTRHQTLDIRLTESAKIGHRSRLISAVLDVMELQRNTNHSFNENISNVKWDSLDGIMPHVGDAIMLFDSS